MPEAYPHFFNLHCHRIYYYLLRQTRDQALAKSLSENTFIALFRSNVPIRDEDYLLRRLYLIARVSFPLCQKGECTASDLLQELAYNSQDDWNIMDDPEVAGNESLLALQEVLQKLTPEKQEIAELIFFQGVTARSIAHCLRVSEEQIKDYLIQAMQKLNEVILDSGENRRTNWRPVSALTPATGGYAAWAGRSTTC